MPGSLHGTQATGSGARAKSAFTAERGLRPLMLLSDVSYLSRFADGFGARSMGSKGFSGCERLSSADRAPLEPELGITLPEPAPSKPSGAVLAPQYCNLATVALEKGDSDARGDDRGEK